MYSESVMRPLNTGYKRKLFNVNKAMPANDFDACWIEIGGSLKRFRGTRVLEATCRVTSMKLSD